MTVDRNIALHVDLELRYDYCHTGNVFRPLPQLFHPSRGGGVVIALASRSKLA